MTREDTLRVPKPWGYELWLANNMENNYCCKILHINGGNRTAMQFHVNKHKTLFIQSGSCKLRTIDTTTATETCITLCDGDTVEINKCTPHQLEAQIDVDIIESSTYHNDSDVYKLWRG